MGINGVNIIGVNLSNRTIVIADPIGNDNSLE